jgi:hypothetical protein
MRKNVYLIKLIFILALQVFFLKAAFAWGAEGHQVVAQIAQSNCHRKPRIKLVNY